MSLCYGHKKVLSVAVNRVLHDVWQCSRMMHFPVSRTTVTATYSTVMGSMHVSKITPDVMSSFVIKQRKAPLPGHEDARGIGINGVSVKSVCFPLIVSMMVLIMMSVCI